MAPLTTYSYFHSDILIPNLTGSLAPNLAIQAKLDQYIYSYEEEFLRLLLGDDTYEDFAAGIVVTPTPEARWTALKNEIWKATVLSQTVTRYESPCARYIFFRFYSDNLTAPVSTGDVQGTFENATPTVNTRRLVYAWNRMADAIEDIWEWIEDDARSADYPDFVRPYPDPFAKINSFGI